MSIYTREDYKETSEHKRSIGAQSNGGAPGRPIDEHETQRPLPTSADPGHESRNHSVAALPHDPKEKENDGVAQLAMGEWSASHELLDGLWWRRTGADVCPELSGVRTPEEEVVGVLGRVEAEGAVVDFENTVTMEKAPRPRIAMPENPKEHPNLDVGEVVPIDLRKRHLAVGLL
jgi:hypothetical protein